MENHIIVVCKSSLPLDRGALRAETLLLEALGYRVKQVADGLLDLTHAGIVWILGNANWFPTICRQLVARSKNERPLVVIWHYEPLPHPKAAGLPQPRLHLREIAKILLQDPRATDAYSNYRRLRRLVQRDLPDLLIASKLGGYEFLCEKGIEAHWVPLGYHPMLGRDMNLPRDLDVLFLGDPNVPRRRGLINNLRHAGVNVLAMGSWFDPSCWGENRTRLVNRSKIFLNLVRYPGAFSALRLLIGMANRTLVISEPMYRPAPFVPGEHYVSATLEEMAGVIDYYLSNEPERRRIAEAGYQFVTQEATLAQSVSRIMKIVQDHAG